MLEKIFVLDIEIKNHGLLVWWLKLPETTLIDFGFENEINILRCRLCDARIPKVGIAVLWKNNPELTTTLSYGWCRRYTHGITVVRTMKQ